MKVFVDDQFIWDWQGNAILTEIDRANIGLAVADEDWCHGEVDWYGEPVRSQYANFSFVSRRVRR